MLNDKHDSYSVNSLLICAQAALLGGTASNHDVINLLDVAQDIISSTMNSFTDSSAPGANVDLFTKEVSASNSPALSFGQRILQARKSASLQQHHIASGAGVTVQAFRYGKMTQQFLLATKLSHWQIFLAAIQCGY